MQYEVPACHVPRPRQGDSPRNATPQDDPTGDTQCPNTPQRVAPGDQWIGTTASRRTGPRRWLRSVEWHIGSGHHPHANATTLQLAEDLAARMDYDTGHVRYAIDLTIARTGLSRSCITTHAKYLREMGLLAWVSKGSRSNIRRVLGMSGYAGTATVYAAVIPAVYDHAMGHRIHGQGYEARVIVDCRDMSNGSSWTPSLTVVKGVGQVQVVGGVTTTAQRSQETSTPNSTTAKTASNSKRRTILGRTITAAGIQLGHQLAAVIRRHAPWTRRSSHDQLRWICADMAEQQWTEQQAVAFVYEVAAVNRAAGLLWQPARPHALLADGLRKHHQEQRETRQRVVEQAALPRETIDAATWYAMVRGDQAPEPEPERTDEDRRYARQAGRMNIQVVIDHLEDHGDDDAIDLYGTALAARAAGLAASTSFKAGAFA